MITILIELDTWDAEVLLNHDGIPASIANRIPDSVDRLEIAGWVSIETNFWTKVGPNLQAWLDSLGKSNYMVIRGE